MRPLQQQPLSAHQRQQQQAVSDLQHQEEALGLHRQAEALEQQVRARQHLAISEQVRLYQEQEQWDNQTKQNY